MPMRRELYPDNWDEIAFDIKQKANWKCEECGKECRQVGESMTEFINRLVPKVHCKYSYDLLDEILTTPKKFVLTVAHLNHVPEDCSPENLKALCTTCHCRYDLKAMATKKRLNRERNGQLNLFDYASQIAVKL